MFCLRCQHDVVDCTCPDIKERLASLLDSNAAPAAATNLRRRLEREAVDEATEGQRPS